jgi:hypothetical protein
MQGVDQLIDGLPVVTFRDVRQMGIACCRGRTGMAEQGLNMAETQATFKEVGSPVSTSG